MEALRSVAVFTALYVAVVLNGVPVPDIPGLRAAVYLIAGFLMAFPVDRVRTLMLWAGESLKLVREFRTCAISSPWLKREQRDWRFIGALKERR